MIEWLQSNYQWLFSGAGVTALLVLGGLLFRSKRDKKSMSTPLDDKPLQAVIDQPAPPPPAVIDSSFSGRTTLSPRDIFARVENTPLLQVPEVQRQFEGLRVTWPCLLVGANKNSDETVRLHLQYESESIPPLITIDVDPKDYPGIGLLRQNHKIEVSASIKKVATISIELSNPRLSYSIDDLT